VALIRLVLELRLLHCLALICLCGSSQIIKPAAGSFNVRRLCSFSYSTADELYTLISIVLTSAGSNSNECRPTWFQRREAATFSGSAN